MPTQDFAGMADEDLLEAYRKKSAKIAIDAIFAGALQEDLKERSKSAKEILKRMGH